MNPQLFTPSDFVELLSEVFPDDRAATFTDVTVLLQRIRDALNVASMPADLQRGYVRDVLHLETVLMNRVVFDAETPGRELSEAEAWETVRNWLAVFWPEDDA